MTQNEYIRVMIEENGFFTIAPKGISMLPLIREGRDTVTVVKPTGRLKKYDIALYERPGGMLTLHRVVRVKKNGYVFCGDNQYAPEHGITDKNIIGVVTEIRRDGEVFDTKNKGYIRQVKKRCAIMPIKYAAHRLLDPVIKKNEEKRK